MSTFADYMEAKFGDHTVRYEGTVGMDTETSLLSVSCEAGTYYGVYHSLRTRDGNDVWFIVESFGFSGESDLYSERKRKFEKRLAD